MNAHAVAAGWSRLVSLPGRGRASGRGRSIALMALFVTASAQAALYGYTDERGVAHFSAEKLDARYQLVLRDDTAGRFGAEDAVPAEAAQALQQLLASRTGAAAARSVYGYLDEQGQPHFADSRQDERYELIVRDGEVINSRWNPIDRRKPLPPVVASGEPPRKGLLALVEKPPLSPAAKTALRDAARKHGLDESLLHALMAAESGFDIDAVSPKGAVGLMQLMPATAERYGVRADAKQTVAHKLTDPRINIAAGSRYFSDLLKMFDGSMELALAAYNAGEGAVQRAGRRIPDYRETQNYVKTVMQLYAHLKPAAVSRLLTASTSRGAKPASRVRMEIAPPSAERDSGAE